MKKKKTKDLFRLGTDTVDIKNIKHYELAALIVVVFLAIIAGALYALA